MQKKYTLKILSILEIVRNKLQKLYQYQDVTNYTGNIFYKLKWYPKKYYLIKVIYLLYIHTHTQLQNVHFRNNFFISDFLLNVYF